MSLAKYNIDPYVYMGVTRQDSFDHIKKTYKEKCKLYHPDKRQGNSLHYNLLNEAFTVISNEMQSVRPSTNWREEEYRNEYEFNQNQIAQLQQQTASLNNSESSSKKFNEMFEQNKQITPFDDRGYPVERIMFSENPVYDPNDVPVIEKNEELLKKFDISNFNSIFENQVGSCDHQETVITDNMIGVAPLQTQFSQIATWNGLMIHNTGSNSVGCDYREAFKTPTIIKNRDSISNLNEQKIEEMKRKREAELQDIKLDNWSVSQQRLQDKHQAQIDKKKQMDTEFVQRYSSMFPQSFVEAAKQGLLLDDTPR
jgi:hypothetical protein